MMKKNVYILFLLIFIISTKHSFADRIYLKSGKILDGKVMQISADPLFEQECDSADSVIVGNNCVEKDQIEKVERVFKKPQGAELLAKEDQWGPEIDGYIYQLIPANNQYIWGQPIVFHLVIKNVSNELKWFQHAKVDNDTLLVKDSRGNEIIYKIGSFQISGFREPIDAGETATVFKNRDISGQYLFPKPGVYSVEYRNGSNVLVMDIKSTTEAVKDVLISSVSGIVSSVEEDKLINNSAKNNESAADSLTNSEPGLSNRIQEEMFIKKDKDPTNIIEYLSQEKGEDYVYISNNTNRSWIKIINEILLSLGLKKNIKMTLIVFLGIVFFFFIIFRFINKSK